MKRISLIIMLLAASLQSYSQHLNDSLQEVQSMVWEYSEIMSNDSSVIELSFVENSENIKAYFADSICFKYERQMKSKEVFIKKKQIYKIYNKPYKNGVITEDDVIIEFDDEKYVIKYSFKTL